MEQHKYFPGKILEGVRVGGDWWLKERRTGMVGQGCVDELGGIGN